ncbi:MAG: glycoside hydrolase family 38 C-terminal domain-containing protein [Opitutaceae bacterium]|jgi:alpha-mannosidase
MKLLSPSDATDRLDALILRVHSTIHIPVAPLELTAWRTVEPVPFAERERGERIEVRVGEPWAEQLFDCAWMRFRARLPEGTLTAGLVARIDVNGELCVVDREGVPMRGLTNIKSTFDPTLGGPGKTIYALPPESIRDGVVELWADAGLNDLFGFVKDEGRVALAEIAVVREDVRALYYDLETLRDWLLTLPEEAATGVHKARPYEDECRGAPCARPLRNGSRDLVGMAARLREDLEAVAVELDCEDPDSVARERERLAPWFANEGPRSELIVHAIGHAHLDLAWLWPIRETIRKGTRTFASALYNIERYPEYVFGMSQPQLYAWLKEHQLELYLKIKHAVAEGRIEPQGTFWVEPDCSMPSGEAFVRQVLHGARFFREEFGVVPNYCWQPDVFGYHGQLPQILKKSGHDYFMTQKLSWNVVNRFGHHSFQWEGIDSTRILTHMLPEETYNGPGAARSLRKIADEYAERDVSNHALMVFGIGDGGGGPDAEHLERLRRAPKLPGMPEVKIGKVSDFFEVWSRDADQFPVWSGELYLERHQGTLTTQALVKRNNRRAEIALRELEWAAYLATTRTGVPYPTAELDRIWKEVLLYQFHDILPGSSIKRVYDECNARYAVILDELARLTHGCYAAVAVKGGVTVFNSLGWERSEWVRHDGAWAWVEVPALGCAQLRSGGHGVPALPLASERLLENENLRVVFAEDGRIASVYDKRRGCEALAVGEFGNDLVVIADAGDAWDFETDLVAKDVWGYLRREVEQPALRESTVGMDGPCAWVRQVWTHRSSEIRQTITLFADAEQLVFKTEVDWREPATMLRVRFPVAVQANSARFEIPFGHIKRSTREETLVERAQIEVAALQWVDLSDESGRGVALYNDCKHGFRVKGQVIDMTLLRSVPYPGAPLIGKGDSADGEDGHDGKVYGDLGRHVFSYALRPHSAEVDAARLTAEARMFNTPLAVVEGRAKPNGWNTPAWTPGIAGIEIAAVKRAEDGDGWIWRLVNVTAGEVECRLPDGDWVECDLTETALQSLSRGSGDMPQAKWKGFEIRTFRLIDQERQQGIAP